MFAEHFGLSGILSAVAAGMTMNYASIAHVGPLDVRVRTQSAWLMIEFVFNGIVFTLLGMQFPHIIAPALIDAHRNSAADMSTLIGYVAAVVMMLYALRFVWVWLLRWFASRTASRHGVKSAVPGLRTAALTTVAGVRGAITLAGVLRIGGAWRRQATRRSSGARRA
jgi:CPA1 family monovalent cation:H+ antiporter